MAIAVIIGESARDGGGHTHAIVRAASGGVGGGGASAGNSPAVGVGACVNTGASTGAFVREKAAPFFISRICAHTKNVHFKC
mmetsp:Transcript_45493/g.52547  ORF Transcript_45493/g.52547 Transcript_45493/m.52547 type:complete len:82 (+) Transcript_45493:239-484(+)